MSTRPLGGTTRARAHAEGLAPIRIFTAEMELDGFVAPAGQRITDILLRGQDLPFLPAGAETRPENWISISPTEILMAAPPPLPRRGPWPARHEKRSVSFRVGMYVVDGTAHVRADGGWRSDVAERPTFVPLTDAELTRSGADERERYAVLIVNTTWSSESGG